jgi:hypothetical protein
MGVLNGKAFYRAGDLENEADAGSIHSSKYFGPNP